MLVCSLPTVTEPTCYIIPLCADKLSQAIVTPESFLVAKQSSLYLKVFPRLRRIRKLRPKADTAQRSHVRRGHGLVVFIFESANEVVLRDGRFGPEAVNGRYHERFDMESQPSAIVERARVAAFCSGGIKRPTTGFVLS